MRISDWSSDVCSSDLDLFEAAAELFGPGNKSKPLEGTVVVGAVAGGGPLRWCQHARVLVVAQGSGSEACESAHLGDAVAPFRRFGCAHGLTVNLRDRKSTRLNSSH